MPVLELDLADAAVLVEQVLEVLLAHVGRKVAHVDAPVALAAALVRPARRHPHRPTPRARRSPRPVAAASAADAASSARGPPPQPPPRAPDGAQSPRLAGAGRGAAWEPTLNPRSPLRGRSSHRLGLKRGPAEAAPACVQRGRPGHKGERRAPGSGGLRRRGGAS